MTLPPALAKSLKKNAELAEWRSMYSGLTPLPTAKVVVQDEESKKPPIKLNKDGSIPKKRGPKPKPKGVKKEIAKKEPEAKKEELVTKMIKTAPQAMLELILLHYNDVDSLSDDFLGWVVKECEKARAERAK